MAELSKIRFFLFVALMIFPVHALDVILSGAHQNFKQKSEINIDIQEGVKIYGGTLNRLAYEAKHGISKVIIYIISRSRCIELLRPTGVARDIRSQIAQELHEMHCELVFLGIENFDDDEYHLIGAFIFDTIRRHPNQADFNIATIGINRFDHYYGYDVMNFQNCRENGHIYGGILLARLRSVPHGARRPVGSNMKEIKLYGYYPTVVAVKWNVSVENNTYRPDVELDDPEYNFMKRYPKKKICLLILGGNEYSKITKYGSRCFKRLAMKNFLTQMKTNNIVLFVMGVFNFDWTEVDIVTQIILQHSQIQEGSAYNVFTCGYGMFDTFYRNEYEGDKRCIRRIPNSYVYEAIKEMMGEEVKQRAINVFYRDGEWKPLNIPIHLGNGRYVPEFRFYNFTLPRQYQKIAFIVYDRAEMNVPINYFVVGNAMHELEQSGISVVFIEPLNFGLDDMHIIAEWIDRHSGVIDSERIAVLGGGLFDTIFQSEFTTYNTYLNTKKNELESIRNAYVKSANGKSVFAAIIDEYENFEVRSYPMTTVVNGFYELDLIPDKYMFDATGGKKIYFIITSVYHFQRYSAIKNLKVVSSSFRYSVKKCHSTKKWSIFLVGLNNFGERDSHLFAELVKAQTNYGRDFGESVRTFNYNISPATYQYRDTTPLTVDNPRTLIQERFEMDMQTYT